MFNCKEVLAETPARNPRCGALLTSSVDWLQVNGHSFLLADFSVDCASEKWR